MAFASSSAIAANLLSNGSFEDGADGFDDWTLGGSSLDGFPPVVIGYNNTNSYPTGAFGESIPTDNAVGNPAFDAVGRQAVYFVADRAGPQTLSQAVAGLVLGQTYQFGFDVYIPQNGQNNANPADLSASVGGINFGPFNAGALAAQNWFHYSTTGVSTVNGAGNFQFTFNSGGIPAKDFVVDRVYLTAAIPEPTTWAMMLVGFGAVGGAMRSRSRRRIASFV
ncbi:hypothetical protein FHS49_001405 [Sphingobium boeckii]|uniref:Ice-binding protein C-terminal domain-containing protein n=2 Tax=Sphingobium boeckii TaxID=1082345 RepID=A0A7W9EDR6_9SPHN|nr:hypothetical protein [Sphingobium boeckii]